MRIKIQTQPPLASLKAWFALDSSSLLEPHERTIVDLKNMLLERVPDIYPSETSVDQLTLEVDGFQLLNGSGWDVLREGDVVTIKVAYTAKVLLDKGKRKAVDEVPLQRFNKRTKKTSLASRHSSVSSTSLAKSTLSSAKPPAVTRTSSSSEADSSSSESSSEVSSDTDTESSSDMDSSESSSSSDSAPSMRTSKIPKHEKPSGSGSKVNINERPISFPAQKRELPKPTVPPGKGKKSTQERNARRRKKRQFSQIPNGHTVASITAPAIMPVDIPLPASPPVSNAPQDLPMIEAQYSSVQQPLNPMITSLRNSNKKKGFKASMQQAYQLGGRRIVFGNTLVDTASPAIEENPSPMQQQNTKHQSFTPRLIPPSERTDLPTHVFITSVDVEAGLWSRYAEDKAQVDSSTHMPQTTLQKRRNKKKKPAVLHPYVEYNGNEEVDMLNYGEPDDVTDRPSRVLNHNGQPDWDGVTRNWESYPLVGSTQVPDGTIVGFYALGLDPATFTPQVLLHIGKILPSIGNSITVQLFNRPGLVVDDEEELEENVETFPPEETDGWKILQAA